MWKPLAPMTLVAIVAAAPLMQWHPATDQARAVTTTPAASVDNPVPWRTGDPIFQAPAAKPSRIGVTYHGMWPDLTDAQRATMLDKMAAAGVRWVRLDVAWKSLQPDGPSSYDLNWGVPFLEKRLNEISSRGMKAAIMLYWAPTWASGTSAKNGVPRNPADFANAAAWVAGRFAGKVQAIELWNEPDLSIYLANRSVVTYTNLVRAAYPKIKAANPSIAVVAGSPTAVNTDWYAKFYANGGADHYDALGIHPYLSPSDLPPTACDPKWKMFYPCNIADLVTLMRANGDGDKQIWATEYGWSSHNNSAYPAPLPNWKRGVTQQTQANYLISMQQVLAQWPQVTASFWYTDRDTAVGDAMEDNYGLFRRDLTPKPVYYALKCAASNICGPSSTTGDPTSYVGSSASWRYAPAGADLGTTWRSGTYSDSGWQTGVAQLGYGDGDERTVIGHASSTSQSVTSYFRTSFDAGTSVKGVTSLKLSTLADDGVIVYLNGNEIWRSNLPAGSVTASTPALTAVSGAAESSWRSVTVPATHLRSGQNVLAAEVHNSAPSSSDISWAATLTR